MLFSVIIPTYNRLTFVKAALASVSSQSFTDYEVIVVDDGSTDGTADYIQGLNPKLQVLRQPNRGPGAARNFGAGNAQGQYLAFLDSDDLWFPWTLSVFADAISKFHRPTLLAGDFIEFTDQGKLDSAKNGLSEMICPSEMIYFRDYLASSEKPYSVGSGTCVLSREAFVRAKFLEDGLNAEDHDLILRMGTQPGFVRIIKPVTLAYRRHDNSETAQPCADGWGNPSASPSRAIWCLSWRGRSSERATRHSCPSCAASCARLPPSRMDQTRMESVPIHFSLERLARTLAISLGLSRFGNRGIV